MESIMQAKEVKSFNDFDFQKHPNIVFDKIAKCRFSNGYGLSVINGECAYCDEDTFEVAILHNDKITYCTPLTNDVLGYQSKEDIDALIETVSGWKKNQFCKKDL